MSKSLMKSILFFIIETALGSLFFLVCKMNTYVEAENFIPFIISTIPIVVAILVENNFNKIIKQRLIWPYLIFDFVSFISLIFIKSNQVNDIMRVIFLVGQLLGLSIILLDGKKHLEI